MRIFSKLRMIRRPPNSSPLYSVIVRQARQPEFYQQLGIPDTVNGRFDLIVLHAYIVMKRLKSIGFDGLRLSQSLFDLMFADMERNLREMGVSDLSVGKKVKALAGAYYGRVIAYDDALKIGGDSLEAAFRRNIYLESTPSSQQLAAMVGYTSKQVQASESWSLEQIREVQFCFRPPPTVE